MLKEGSTAPAFKTKDANGETVNLKDFRGQKVVLYFYPKDDTPGCTKEACSFRDAFASFKKKGIAVLGVSPDNETSHKKFVTKYKLPFTLLADTRSEEHTSELQSHSFISYAVFCLKKKKTTIQLPLR